MNGHSDSPTTCETRLTTKRERRLVPADYSLRTLFVVMTLACLVGGYSLNGAIPRAKTWKQLSCERPSSRTVGGPGWRGYRTRPVLNSTSPCFRCSTCLPGSSSILCIFAPLSVAPWPSTRTSIVGSVGLDSERSFDGFEKESAHDEGNRAKCHRQSAQDAATASELADTRAACQALEGLA